MILAFSLPVVSNFLYFIIVLGLAVIFHEWGHFIVAKLSGAKVDRFAVGFGKKLVSYTWHETEYAVCALPLGGYVKIRGMDFDEELTGEEWEYLQLAPWKRMLIVVAGPIMNFILAFLIYLVIYGCFGEAFTATTTVGQVPEGSVGWEMGLHKGDRIVSINGKTVTSWDNVVDLQDFSNIATASDPGKLSMVIDRNGTILTKEKVFPRWMFEENEPVDIPEDYNGILITRVFPLGAAERAGLKAGGCILSVDGKSFPIGSQWSSYISSVYESTPEGKYQAKDLSLVYQEPNGATRSLMVRPDIILPAEDAIPYHPKTRLGLTFQGDTSAEEFILPTLSTLGVAPKIAPIVGRVQEDGPAQKAGIQSDARIVEINGKPVDDWVEILETIHNSMVVNPDGTASAKSLEFTWCTPRNEMKTATITPDVTFHNLPTPKGIRTGKKYPLALIGIDVKTDRRVLGVIGAVNRAGERFYRDCTFMLDFLKKLFSGNISPKLLGGPIAIYQLSGETGRWGIERLLTFIALLSANLAILNLFPIPPFDGGHVVFYIIEMIRRKPMTMRQMEIFGKIGFVLVIPLIVFLIYNDLNRNDFFKWIGGLIHRAFGAS